MKEDESPRETKTREKPKAKATEWKNTVFLYFPASGPRVGIEAHAADKYEIGRDQRQHAGAEE